MMSRSPKFPNLPEITLSIALITGAQGEAARARVYIYIFYQDQVSPKTSVASGSLPFLPCCLPYFLKLS